jgi:hypothetical protein
MVDTITFEGPWPLRRCLPPRKVIPVGLGKGLRLKVDPTGQFVDWVEASLPRLLFGHNGRLVATADKLDAALDVLAGILQEHAEVPPMDRWQLKRLDLCWNFDLPARPFIMAHGPLQFPGIRRQPTSFGMGNGVSWRGAKSKFVVSMYDKCREMGTTGSVLRVEIRLLGRHLGRFRLLEEWRQFPVLWKTFRTVIASFPAIPAPKKVPDWQTAVGREAPEVRNRIMGCLASRPERTFRRWMARVESAQMPGAFSWASFLSPDGPPAPVHVLPTRSGKLPARRPSPLASPRSSE